MSVGIDQSPPIGKPCNSMGPRSPCAATPRRCTRCTRSCRLLPVRTTSHLPMLRHQSTGWPPAKPQQGTYVVTRPDLVHASPVHFVRRLYVPHGLRLRASCADARQRSDHCETQIDQTLKSTPHCNGRVAPHIRQCWCSSDTRTVRETDLRWRFDPTGLRGILLLCRGERAFTNGRALFGDASDGEVEWLVNAARCQGFGKNETGIASGLAGGAVERVDTWYSLST